MRPSSRIPSTSSAQIHQGCPSSCWAWPRGRRRPAGCGRMAWPPAAARRRWARQRTGRAATAAAPADPRRGGHGGGGGRILLPGAQRLREGAGVREAVGGLALQGAHHDRRQAARHRHERLGRRRILVQALERHPGRRVGLERPPAGQHLVEHDAQRVDVGGPGHLVAPRLLRAEVVDRAQGGAGDRHRGLGHGARDAEVGDLHVAVVGDQDVSRLHVPMDQPATMGRLQG